MIAIKIIIDLCCGALDAWGGHSWHNARRFIMPALIAIAVSTITGVWWLGITILPVMGTLCLGYFSGENWGRALWLFTQAVVIGLGCSLLGHLSWYFYIPYIIGAGLLGGLYKNWKQIYGDFITGSYLGIIIFLVR